MRPGPRSRSSAGCGTPSGRAGFACAFGWGCTPARRCSATRATRASTSCARRASRTPVTEARSSCPPTRSARSRTCRTRDLGEFRLEGLADPERIHQLLADDLPRDFPPLRNTVSTLGAGVTVALADDTVLLREGIARLLSDSGFDVVAQSGDPDDLLRHVAMHKPSVAIVDIRMPPTHTDEGIRAAREIRERFPETSVLVLSQYVEAGVRDGPLRGLDGGPGLPAEGPGRGRRGVRERRPPRRRRRIGARSRRRRATSRSQPRARPARAADRRASARCSSSWPRDGRTRRSPTACS